MADQNVLYISYDGLTDPLGQSQILPYLAALSSHGYRFHIISCEKPDKFEANKAIIEEICQQHQIIWHPLPYTKKPPVFSTIKDHKRIKKTAEALHKKHQFSMVHCRSYISSLTGIYLKKKYGVPYIFDMRGFWADERVDGRIWNLSNPLFKLIYNYFKKKEKIFLTEADAIVILTHAGKRELGTWNIVPDMNRVFVIPCSVDTQLFSSDNLDLKKLEELKVQLDSDFVIGYYGSLGTWYMLDEMMAQFSAVLEQKPEAKFLILSNDEWSPQHEEIRTKHQVSEENLIVTRSARADMPYYIKACNYAIFFITPCFSKTASSPTKHGEIMSMGVPLVANNGVGDMEEFIQKTNSGLVVTEFTKASYQEIAEQITSGMEFNPENIRKEGIKIYGLENAVSTYLEIYQQIAP